MMPKGRLALSAMTLFFLSFNAPILQASSSGSIVGVIRDQTTGEPLPSANILVKGTAYGAVSDLYGKYRILHVPAGAIVLRVTYIGYKTAEVPLTLKPDETVTKNINLGFDANKLKYDVTVTAQQEGQAAAINQQIRSNTIVNVVSKDKIQELPDQNASESLGRLPGIAIQRNAGEGQKVVVRGLSPRFSAVSVNGERLPEASDDRSVDLTMISPDVLAGIEIYKALRPDIDGDAIGGSVNFITKKAPEGAEATVRMFGGYGQLADDYGNYKGSVSYSNRFFRNDAGNGKLGIVATGSIQSANRSSNLLSGSYGWTGMVNNLPVYETSEIVLTDHVENRDRYSLNLAVDYNLGANHDIVLSSLWGQTDRDVKNQIHNYRVTDRSHYRNYNEMNPTSDIWTNSLMGNHVFGKTEINWRTSYSTTAEKTPWYAYFQFEEDGAFSSSMPIKNVTPEAVSTYASNNATAAWMNWTVLENHSVKDRNLTGQLDVKHPFQFGKSISGYFKVGGKLRNTKREKDVSQWGGNRWYVPVPINMKYPWFTEAKNHKGDIALANFILENKKSLESFLEGDYTFSELLDMEKLHWFATTFDSVYKKTPHPEFDANDYTAGETITAGYVMAEFNWKNRIIFMPGVRYEKTQTDYATKMLSPLQSEGGKRLAPAFNDTLGNRSYDNLLPSFHLRLKPLSWFDIRLAATQSLTRPNFYSLIPFELIQWDLLTLQYGNSQLKEATAANYDAYLSFYSRYGLFTVGSFYKKVKNIDYVRTTPNLLRGYYAPYLTNLKGWTVIRPENLDDDSIAKGWEFELQTNLKFLPSPLDGIVLYANFSTIESETKYPYTIYRTKFTTTPPYVVTSATDTARVARMLGQADKIANLTLGYEKGGFSGRLSMIYQGNSLQYINNQAKELDGIDDASIRWDLVMMQRIFKGLTLIANVNNITNQEEKSYIRYQEYPTRRELYGRTLDLGLQFKM
jgi:TonB-dependent receptor